MQNIAFTLVVLAFTTSVLLAEDAAPAAPAGTETTTTNQTAAATPPAAEESAAPQFQNGDRVCFVGDSITQTGFYLFNIMLYYATHFPDRKIEGYNCGVNGASTGGLLVLKAYDWDVLVHKPTVVTLMYGMNDVGRAFFGKDKIGPDWDNKRKWGVIGYANNMRKISEIFTQAHCSIIYLTPSIYDQTGNQAAYNCFGVNDALGVCAEDCRKLVPDFHAGLVDFNGPMGRINAEQQQKDPSFTLVGPDRIHPLGLGGTVMAYLFLKAQNVPADVSDMSVDAASSAVVKQENCAISNVKVDPGTVSFVVRENSLPLPFSPDDLKKVDAFVPFTHDLDREMLTVANLPAGNYQLSIDGQPVQDSTADDLKSGINLALDVNTPQYQQASQVNKLCSQRRGLEQLIRTYMGSSGAIFAAHLSLDDEAASRKIIQAELDDAVKNKKNAPHLVTWLKYSRAEWKQMEADAAALWDKVYTVNQPVPHTFEIRPK
jgi:endoglucanase